MSEKNYILTESQLKAIADFVTAVKPVLDLYYSQVETLVVCPYCKNSFVKARADQVYCCPVHQRQAWRDGRRKKGPAVASVATPATEIKCRVQGCENRFILDLALPNPYFCRECAKSIV